MRSQLLFARCYKNILDGWGQPSKQGHVDNQTFRYRAKFQKLWIGHALRSASTTYIAPGTAFD